MSIQSQPFQAIQQRNVENIVAIQTQIFSGLEQLLNLNMTVFKDSLDQIAETSQQVSQLKDAQQALSFTNNLPQPSAEKIINYSKNVFEILSQTQKEVTQLVEKQIADNQQNAIEVIEELAKKAPAGSEGAISLVKSGFVAASNATDTALKVARQASDLSQANVQAATGAAFKTAEQAAEVVEKNIARAARKTN